MDQSKTTILILFTLPNLTSISTINQYLSSHNIKDYTLDTSRDIVILNINTTTLINKKVIKGLEKLIKSYKPHTYSMNSHSSSQHIS